jgi:tripartite ATP-independent transporter DctM subunit
MIWLIGTAAFLMLVGVPIAFSLGMASALYLVQSGGMLLAVPHKLVAAPDSFPLLALPFFMLAGSLMNSMGLTDRIFRFAGSLVGHITGGLGHVNVLTQMIFAGMSGSALADAAGLGRVTILAMEKAGFDKAFSVGLTGAAACIGPIIPPSVVMVIYGVLTGTSIVGLFLGGFIPGTLMGITLMILVYFLSKARRYPTEQRASLRQVLRDLRGASLTLLTPIIILSGMTGGIFTATEAAAIACLYAIFLGVCYRTVNLRELTRIFLDTVESTAVVVLIMANAVLFAWLLTQLQIPQKAVASTMSFTRNPLIILLLLNLVLLILGCLLDGIAILIITIPVIQPIILSAGIDPLHFGVVMTLNIVIGGLTPPFGMMLFLLANITGLSVEAVTRASMPFLVPLIVTLAIITFVPETVLLIPRLLGYL